MIRLHGPWVAGTAPRDPPCSFVPWRVQQGTSPFLLLLFFFISKVVWGQVHWCRAGSTHWHAPDPRRMPRLAGVCIEVPAPFGRRGLRDLRRGQPRLPDGLRGTRFKFSPAQAGGSCSGSTSEGFAHR